MLHVIAERVYDWTPLLAHLSAAGPHMETTAPTDELRQGASGSANGRRTHPRHVRIDLVAAEVMPKRAQLPLNIIAACGSAP